MNIIRTDRAAPLLPAWWIAWVALLLLLFGAPLFLARLMEAPQEETRLALLEGRPVETEALALFVEKKRRIAGWVRSSALYNDLSMANLALAARAQELSSQTAFYDESLLWQRRALEISSADPYGWFRMAYLLFFRQGAPEKAAQAWRLSVAAAPYEPRLMLPRLRLALSLGPALDESSRHQIPRLIRAAWEIDPTALAKAAKAGNFISIVEETFREDPTLRRHFQDQLDLLK